MILVVDSFYFPPDIPPDWLSDLPYWKNMKLDKKAKDKRNKLKNSIRKKPKVIKHNIPKLVHACDTVFSLYIRFIRDKDKPCITCGRTYEEYDNWHFQVRQHMNTRFSELNCAKQCKWCNKYHSWEQVIFARRIDEIYWAGTSEALEIFARQVSTIKQPELLEIYNRYANLLTEHKIPFTLIKKYLWPQ